MTSFALLFSLAAAQPLPPAQPPPSAELSIVYTGGSGGASSGRYAFDLLRELQLLEQKQSLAVHQLQPFHGVLAQDGWLVHSADQRVASVVESLDSGSLDCGAPEEVFGVESSLELMVLESPGRPAWLEALPNRFGVPQPYLRRLCTSPAGRVLVVLGRQDSDRPPEEALEAFEFRLALAGEVEQAGVRVPFTLVGKPVQEISRTVRRVRSLLDGQQSALFVDAGDFVDGASSVVGAGGLSLHRPVTFDVLEGLRPAALAPGANELLPGPAVFLAEAREHGLPYVATNWLAEDPTLQLPRSQLVTVQTAAGPIRVAFLGLLDPSLAERLPKLAAQGVSIVDPVAAAREEVVALQALAEPPQAIVALTTASGTVQERLRIELRGVDLMLGDRTLATFRVLENDFRLRSLARDVKGAAITLPMDGLSVMDLGFEDGELARVAHRPELIYADDPVERDLTALISRTRTKVYPTMDHILLPAREALPNQGLSEAEWSQVVCEAVRWQTRADSVLLANLPSSQRLPGPQTELQVASQLATLEVLELHRVPGSKLQGLLDKSFGLVPTACGAAPGPGGAKAWGRSIDPHRVYRVVTTPSTRKAGGLDALLAPATAARPLDPAPSEVLLNQEGQPLTLRQAVVDALTALREAPPSDKGLTDWLLGDAAGFMPPLVQLRLSAISLRMERFQGVESEIFAEVPETLATSPSSFTLATAGDMALEASSRELLWDLRLRGAYATLNTEEGGEQETADDWRLSTSLTVPAFGFPLGRQLRMSPYAELMHDSEFTPTTLEDGSENPRQADLSLTAGLAATAWKDLRVLRLGAFSNRDLAQTSKPTEWGGRLELETLSSLGRVLRLAGKADVQLFGDAYQGGVPVADASDLRVRAFGELRLVMPAARYLDLSLYGQGFALKGRAVGVNDSWGASYNLGAALDIKGVFGGAPRL